MAGYKGHSIWDEEEDKYAAIKDQTEITQDYSGNDDYNSSDAKSDYNTGADEEKEEEKKEKELTEFEKTIEKNNPSKQEEGEEKGITTKAAEELFGGTDDKPKEKRAKTKDIEDAIKKAIKEEKELIFID
jgi:hypothetical protein